MLSTFSVKIAAMLLLLPASVLAQERAQIDKLTGAESAYIQCLDSAAGEQIPVESPLAEKLEAILGSCSELRQSWYDSWTDVTQSQFEEAAKKKGADDFDLIIAATIADQYLAYQFGFAHSNLKFSVAHALFKASENGASQEDVGALQQRMKVWRDCAVGTIANAPDFVSALAGDDQNIRPKINWAVRQCSEKEQDLKQAIRTFVAGQYPNSTNQDTTTFADVVHEKNVATVKADIARALAQSSG
ncbi:hypothetical protein GCM10023115_20610 [Pontixanthobacter gangjinensis]|uniref:Lysozyme inhibitor LprI N-terminal domain-containing protein n=1 Tax=Pontixanthobacter gangjinensis TaxID=1028742 RepID=A0A6I4SPK0_9SPHN|nr:hypothetical protein [Pontixanthobacter gangjinensis]MXO57308.1 hypothetical protein [Pontixanthobacter gangjinensis]